MGVRCECNVLGQMYGVIVCQSDYNHPLLFVCAFIVVQNNSAKLYTKILTISRLWL